MHKMEAADLWALFVALVGSSMIVFLTVMGVIHFFSDVYSFNDIANSCEKNGYLQSERGHRINCQLVKVK